MATADPAPVLPATFFDRAVLDVARDLLGATIEHRSEAGVVAVRLTEVEAYDGRNDPGSHAFRGQTRRNTVMFGPPGRVYVYFTYGMHFCMNLVCGPPGTAGAVLLRAGEVVVGRDLAAARRTTSRSDRDLARGPARLTVALGVHREHNGSDATDPDSALVVRAPAVTPADVRSGPRVGVAGDGADHPWRFWLEGDPTVSVYRPAIPRRRRRLPSGRLSS